MCVRHLVISLLVAGTLIPHIQGHAQTPQCERLLGMLNRRMLPSSLPGDEFPSSYQYRGPGAVHHYLSYFFAALRTERSRVVTLKELEKADLKIKILFLHHLSLTMMMVGHNISKLLDPTVAQYEGQQDGSILMLLQTRSQFVLDDVLPEILMTPPQQLAPYFEELTAIAANFADVLTGSKIAVALAAYLTEHFPAARAAAKKIHFHALSNTALEDFKVDVSKMSRLLPEVVAALAAQNPLDPLDWLVCQLAVRFEIGLGLRKLPAAFVTTKTISNWIVDQLPLNLSSVRINHPKILPVILKDLDDLLFALTQEPCLLSPLQAKHLRQLRDS